MLLIGVDQSTSLVVFFGREMSGDWNDMVNEGKSG